MEEFAACWEGLDDPRTGNAALHDFNEMLVIALCCVLSGGQGAVDMGLYARAKEPFLRGFLKLSNGLPSHDAIGAKPRAGHGDAVCSRTPEARQQNVGVCAHQAGRRRALT